ncbi:helix-turn-helix transcriptional regulator [Edaphovirga cremea]|uniref:helix-turn-helix transcriptional regulator n=1 Tax=Edaphovirga cremea TaxID=2267246 RepID=UPI00398932AC
MSQNKIKQYRTQKSITQRELAELVGTSQQQIQRIEAGKVAANLVIAQAISAVLGKPLGAVFPGADEALSTFRGKRNRTAEDLSQIANEGIEMDGCEWTLKLYLKGQNEAVFLPINQSDKRRFFAHFEEEETNDTVQFFVFDSDEYRFALNIREVVFHQFLFEPLGAFIQDDEADEKDYSNVRITVTNGGPTIRLSVESDELEDGEEDTGQLSYIFYMLESDTAPGERYQITDADGEDAFIRAGSIAILQVALSVLEPNEEEDE